MYDKMNETMIKLMLIRSIGVNHPILRDWKIGLSVPLLLLVDRGQADQALRLLLDNTTERVTDFLSESDILRLAREINSDFLGYHYLPSQRGDKIIEILISVARSQEHEKFPACLIVSEEIPMGIEAAETFTLCLEGNLREIEFSVEDVLPLEGHIPVVREQLLPDIQKLEMPEERTLLGAACLTFDFLDSGADKELLAAVRTTTHNLAEQGEECRENDDLTEIFLDLLYDWRDGKHFSAVEELPYMSEEANKSIQEWIFYDDRYLYIGTQRIRDICRSVTRTIPLKHLMQTLTEGGLLLPDSRKTYTSKMRYYNPAGELQSTRMMKFDRARLHRVGEQEFIEECQDEKDNMEEE